MRHSNKNKGNALTEFIIVAGVLVPAVLVIPSLGKISDVNLATIEASRYAVWERTVSDSGVKTDEQLEVEIRNRFFTDQNLLILSEREEVLESDTSANAFWRSVHNSSSGQTLLVDNENSVITVTTENRSIPGGIGADILSEGIADVVGAMDAMIPGAEWDLDGQGFYVAEIGTEVKSQKLFSDQSGCTSSNGGGGTVAVSAPVKEDTACLQQRYAMFVDEWDSGSPDETDRRVRALVPAGTLQRIANGISVFGKIPLFEELEKLDGVFGQVEEDILPLDRYGDEQ